VARLKKVSATFEASDEHADEIISVPSQKIFDLNVGEKVTFRYA
jgi:hypothetical protein